MKKLLRAGSMVMLCAIMTGCSCGTLKSKAQSCCPAMTAHYTSVPVVIDGKFDDAVWQNAVVYPMDIPQERVNSGMFLQGQGSVRFAWDDNYFYVGMDFTDMDVVAEGQKDQLLHYEFGDVGELFFKPEASTWYWELYVTPRGTKTSIWFPGRGRLFVPSSLEYHCGLTVAAAVNGTLNDWKDKDNGWTAEMAMPAKDLTAFGDQFGVGSSWRILIGRYNYSRYSKWLGAELSSAPQLEKANYHSLEEYAKLQFVK